MWGFNCCMYLIKNTCFVCPLMYDSQCCMFFDTEAIATVLHLSK